MSSNILPEILRLEIPIRLVTKKKDATVKVNFRFDFIIFSIRFVIYIVFFPVKYFNSLISGFFNKLKKIGIKIIDIKNIPKIFIDATIPNSFKILLSVKMKVANPSAVVKFAKSDAFPILIITFFNDLILSLFLIISCLNLFIKKIQFGTPITIIKGGIKAVNTVISY